MSRFEHPSPALSTTSNFSDFTDEELDKYFASYVPLSNLPTPPPAKENRVRRWGQHDGQAPELEKFATHLTNIVTPAPQTQTWTSSASPSIPLIHQILIRANLPVEIIAFAACILSNLSPSTSNSVPPPSIPAPSLDSPHHHDLNLVILSALALAHDYLDDRSRTTKHWSVIEAGGCFDVGQIEAAKWYILRQGGWGLGGVTAERVDAVVKGWEEEEERKEVVVLGGGEKVQSWVEDVVECGGTKMMAGVKVEVEIEVEVKVEVEVKRETVWINGLVTPEPSP